MKNHIKLQGDTLERVYMSRGSMLAVGGDFGAEITYKVLSEWEYNENRV